MNRRLTGASGATFVASDARAHGMARRAHDRLTEGALDGRPWRR